MIRETDICRSNIHPELHFFFSTFGKTILVRYEIKRENNFQYIEEGNGLPLILLMDCSAHTSTGKMS